MPLSDGEKQGVRERIDQMAKDTIEANQGKVSRDEAFRIARRAARYVVDGKKHSKD